ncbi:MULTISPECIES: sugar ABC transporter permease [unclassified Mesorhizobium]|uniref:carbohydrate ABC transporter permease n=2 Tax=Mesorhizobium TaxID=68287 RepID=UPI001FE124F0|nr:MULTISPECIES: sugar ABC transporter permease [unclassified Mesorhizobium]
MRDERIKYLFVWPAFLIVLAVSIFPLIYALTVSFQSMRLTPPLPARFVGLENYLGLLASARFWGAIATTSIIVLISVAVQYCVGLALALSLHSNVPGERLYRPLFLFPMFMAPVAVALVARMIFSPTLGPLNEFATFLGFPNLPFLTQANWAIAVIAIVEIWQWTPLVTLLMLAGLQGLPREVFEAAAIENASPWQRFWSITFPMLLPLSVAVVFIRIIEGLKIIDTVFVLTGGGPGTSTETLTLFAYNEGFKKFNLGQASALSFLFLMVITLFGIVYLALARPLMEKRT